MNSRLLVFQFEFPRQGERGFGLEGRDCAGGRRACMVVGKVLTMIGYRTGARVRGCEFWYKYLLRLLWLGWL